MVVLDQCLPVSGLTLPLKSAASILVWTLNMVPLLSTGIHIHYEMNLQLDLLLTGSSSRWIHDTKTRLSARQSSNYE